MTPDLDALERAARAVTKGDLATAEITKDGSRPCPCCDTEGYVDGRDYINIDDVPLNVQFSGIGPEFKRWEAYFKAAQPAAILTLISRLRTAEAALAGARESLEGLMVGCRWERISMDGLILEGWQTKRMPDDESLDRARAWLSQNPQETK